MATMSKPHCGQLAIGTPDSDGRTAGGIASFRRLANAEPSPDARDESISDSIVTYSGTVKFSEERWRV
jgi:hypothetical protein